MKTFFVSISYIQLNDKFVFTIRLLSYLQFMSYIPFLRFDKTGRFATKFTFVVTVQAVNQTRSEIKRYNL